jgi:hypothetical protein
MESMMDALAFRPCGACGGYVSSDKGCKHWRPGIVESRATIRQRERLARQKAQFDLLRQLRRNP